MSRHKGVAPQLPAQVISAGVSAVIAVVYLAIVVRRQHGPTGRSIFVACFLVVVAGLLIASMRVESPLQRAALLTGAANSLIALGFLALFSVGLPLLIAGAVALPSVARALAQTPRPMGPTIAAVASLAAVTVIVVGLLVT